MKPTASEPAQFHLGMQQSVVDVRGAGRWCTELKPSSKEQQIARTSLGKRG